jgi:transcriptional regulator GlxA family with amidase domain
MADVSPADPSPERPRRPAPRRPISRVDIVVYRGFDELDAIGPYEVLINAARAGAPVEVRLVGSEGAAHVTASHGLRIGVAEGLESGPDLVLVPGGGWNAEPGTPGARAEVERRLLPAKILALHAEGVTIASVCTGAMIVAEVGLFEGRPGTTHQGARDDLARLGARLIDARVVDAGDLISAGGVTSGIDLALWLVEREWGRDLADAVALQIEHKRVGAVWIDSA